MWDILQTWIPYSLAPLEPAVDETDGSTGQLGLSGVTSIVHGYS